MTVATSSDAYKTLKTKIETNQARVGVIGLGYVGLPLAHALHQGGLPVMGFDVDEEKPKAIREGRNYLKHLGSDMVTSLRDSKRFEATTDFARLGECDVILVCVPTPLGRHQEPDISYILQTADAIGKTLRKGQLIVLESTTYPGTTREDMMPAVFKAAGARAKDWVLGEDVFAAFSPEREDPGRKSHSTSTIPKLVGGVGKQATELAAAVYRKGIKEVIEVSSAEIAESAKLLENIFRAVNIALVNELKTTLTPMGIDVWEVIRAAGTKPFGFMSFFPGPGLGGHCIPIDPFYLTWKAKEFGCSTKFIELAGEINTSMPDYVVGKVMLALNDAGKPVKGARILILGLAYKANVDDDRESPTYRLMGKLEELGAVVSYNDPYVPVIRPSREHARYAGRRSAPISGDFDLLLVATAHDEYRELDLLSFGIPVVDTRNLVGEKHENCYRA